MSLSQNLAVKFVAAYTAAGFVIMEILYLGVWCRPFTQYWAVPPENSMSSLMFNWTVLTLTAQCSAATNHLITNAVINITSDIMIILIPMPIFLKSQLPLKRKVVLIAVFALGAFTVSLNTNVDHHILTSQILSAILNKFYSFNEPFGSNWTFWYIRESSTAIITANLPYIWTLLRRIFKLGSFSGSTYGKGTNNPSKAYRSNFTNHRSVVRSQIRADHALHQVDSEEEINGSYALPLKIYAKHEVQITSEEAGPDDRNRRGPVGCIPDELMSRSKDSIRTDDPETNSERSAAGVVKVFHGV
jgi:hypothetical protein